VPLAPAVTLGVFAVRPKKQRIEGLTKNMDRSQMFWDGLLSIMLIKDASERGVDIRALTSTNILLAEVEKALQKFYESAEIALGQSLLCIFVEQVIDVYTEAATTGISLLDANNKLDRLMENCNSLIPVSERGRKILHLQQRPTSLQVRNDRQGPKDLAIDALERALGTVSERTIYYDLKQFKSHGHNTSEATQAAIYENSESHIRRIVRDKLNLRFVLDMRNL
jgi:hypothetical protein